MVNIDAYAFAYRCLKKYSALLRSKQNKEWLLFAKGQCFLGLGKLQKARDCFEKSYELKHWLLPYAQLIDINKKLGKFKVATRIKKEISALNPNF